MLGPNSPAQNSKNTIFLLPNLFTLAGLFCGFFAIISAFNNLIEQAVISVFVAMVFDALDGRIARMTNSQSNFGAQLDSLSDLVSFGVAPALITYCWGLQAMGKFGWICAFIFLACAAFRLARFSSENQSNDLNYFQGLPSPAAAGLIVSAVWTTVELNLAEEIWLYVMAIVLFVAGILMISNFRFNAFKQIKSQHSTNLVQLILLLLVFAAIAVRPAEVLLAIFSLYVFSGPVLTVTEQKGVKLELLVGDDKDADFPPESINSQKDKEK